MTLLSRSLRCICSIKTCVLLLYLSLQFTPASSFHQNIEVRRISTFARKTLRPPSNIRCVPFVQQSRLLQQRQQRRLRRQHQCRNFSSSALEALRVSRDSGDGTFPRRISVLRKLPKWMTSEMPPLLQLCFAIGLYMFHLTVLTQHQVVFPFQLFPASSPCQFTGIGWDSIAGMATLLVYWIVRKSQRQQQQQQQQLPSLLSHPSEAITISATYSNATATNTTVMSSSATAAPWQLPRESVRFRLSSFIACVLLIQAYFGTGRFSLFWDDSLYTLSGLDILKLTAPMHRSCTVLLGHLSWVLTGAAILRWIPRPPKFFAKQNNNLNANQEGNKNNTTIDNNSAIKWFTCRFQQTNWLWWTVGGYFVSSWLFNCADLVNHVLLPEAVLNQAEESVVTQLVQPEYNDVAASVIGYIAPCISAPWWEEVLYRGFLLSLLTQVFGYHWAVLIQGIVFSAHHMNLTAAFPLAVLGWTWAVLYTKSKNLWTTIFVHAMWNSRVFLGSWLGL